MSILVETSSFKSKVNIDLPKGNFNSNSQTWDFKNGQIGNYEDFAIYMATNTPTTFSATSNTGKDSDADDKGS